MRSVIPPDALMSAKAFAATWAVNRAIAETMEAISAWYAQTKSSRGRGPTRAAQLYVQFRIHPRAIRRWRAWRRGLSHGRRRFLFGPAPIRWRDLPRSVRATVEKRLAAVAQIEAVRARAGSGGVVPAMDGLARWAGVSRVTLYRRLKRFRRFGPAGLIDGRVMRLQPLGRRNVGPLALESARARTGVAG